jgi:Protein of unknown function (DUF1681)
MASFTRLQDEPIQITLYVNRCVKVYRVPPRLAAGHRSGEWRVDSLLWSGRLRMLARGTDVEIRLENPDRHAGFGCTLLALIVASDSSVFMCA